MLAWVPKGIGFVAMLRVLTAVIPTDVPPPSNILTNHAVRLSAIIAIVTMVLGNTVALTQTNLKRLFAYSSIAHAGYLMIGVAVAFRNGPSSAGTITLGASSVLFYLVTYALMTLGAFGVMIALSTPERPVETIEDVAGLAKEHPIAAASMAICLFSLAGIPPFAGFIGKFNLFVAAFSASTDDDASTYQALAVIGVLNSAIGAYYYLKIVVAMYYREPSGPPLAAPKVPWPTAAAISACVGLTVLLGVYAQPLYSAADASALALISRPAPIARLAAAEPISPEAEAKYKAQLEAEREEAARRGIRWAPPVRRP
jgi:NADH-quinone oxidoreductase subunit N